MTTELGWWGAGGSLSVRAEENEQDAVALFTRLCLEQARCIPEGAQASAAVVNEKSQRQESYSVKPLT